MRTEVWLLPICILGAAQLSATPAQAADEPPSPRIRIERRLPPPPLDALLNAAWQACQNGDSALASAHYATVLNRHPHNRDALMGLATLALRQGQDGLASDYLSRLLALDARDEWAHAAWAALDPAGGESRLQNLLEQSPYSALLRLAQANSLAAQTRWAEARMHYARACPLLASFAPCWFNWAVADEQLGEPIPAAAHYRTALHLDPDGHSGFSAEKIRQRGLAAPETGAP